MHHANKVYIKNQFILLLMLAVCLPSAQAAKSMKDDEIKKLIVQGSLRDYDAACPANFLYELPKEIKPDSVSQQTSREFQYGHHWGIKDAVSETQTQTTQIPSKWVCVCPCPYSRDLTGKECGQDSAYFVLRDEDKPKCYPEDVQVYEVNDFRSDHGIAKP